MPRFTDNLSLALPRGSKYWNYDTWDKNMEILMDAFKEVGDIADIEVHSADRVAYDNTFTPMINATTVQDAIPEVKAKSNQIVYQTITSDTTIEVPTDAHAYYILTFGDNVPRVNFVKSNQQSQEVFLWMNGMPEFHSNKVYEISFLKLCCIWYERSPFDFESYFEFYVEDSILYITRIKAEEWFAAFGNYDIIIPNYAMGYPVMIDDH